MLKVVDGVLNEGTDDDCLGWLTHSVQQVNAGTTHTTVLHEISLHYTPPPPRSLPLNTNGIM